MTSNPDQQTLWEIKPKNLKDCHDIVAYALRKGGIIRCYVADQLKYLADKQIAWIVDYNYVERHPYVDCNGNFWRHAHPVPKVNSKKLEIDNVDLVSLDSQRLSLASIPTNVLDNLQDHQSDAIKAIQEMLDAWADKQEFTHVEFLKEEDDG